MPYRILTSQACSSFRELSKTLFSCPPRAVFHGKNHEIKSALNFCPPLYGGYSKVTDRDFEESFIVLNDQNSY